MIYGYCIVESKIVNDWSTDRIDEAKSKVHKVRLFAIEKDRDSAAEVELKQCRKNSHYNSEVHKFVTKEIQGGLEIIKHKKK